MENTLSFINFNSGLTFSGKTITYTYPKEFEFKILQVQANENWYDDLVVIEFRDYYGSALNKVYYNYDFYVDWGDGSPIEHYDRSNMYDVVYYKHSIYGPPDQPTISHRYGVSGQYFNIKFSGLVESINFGSMYVGGYGYVLTEIISWGNVGCKDIRIYNNNLNKLPNEIGRFEDIIFVPNYAEASIEIRHCSFEEIPFGFSDHIKSYTDPFTHSLDFVKRLPNCMFQKNPLLRKIRAFGVNGSLGYNLLEYIPEKLLKNIETVHTYLEIESFGGSILLGYIPGKMFSYLPNYLEQIYLPKFDNNIKLKNIGSGFFSGLPNNPNIIVPDDMFLGSNVLEQIPSDLFSGLTDNYNNELYAYGMFEDCINLQEIPSDLFSNLVEDLEIINIQHIFNGCISLLGLPDNLFNNLPSNLKLLNIRAMFYGCNEITSIPEDLFWYLPSGLTSIYARGMFQGSGISTLEPYMFNNLPSTINTQDFTYMFSQTNISGIPSGFFYGLNSNFDGMFSHCLNIYNNWDEPITSSTFTGLNSYVAYNFDGMFYGCENLNHAPELWNWFPNSHGVNCFAFCDNIDNRESIPSWWGS